MKGMLLVLALLGGCGSSDNLFFPLVHLTSQQKAERAIASGDWQQAISALASYVAAHPSDAQASTTLATAYLGDAGISALVLGASVASALAGGSSNWNALASALPSGTPAQTQSLSEAVAVLSAVPPASCTQGTYQQLAVAQLALAALVVKQTAGEPDPATGSFPASSVAAISDADAALIYTSIAGAAASLTLAGVTGQGSNIASTMAEGIAAQPGSTGADKLRSYLLSV